MIIFYELEDIEDDKYFRIVPNFPTFNQYKHIYMDERGGSVHVLLSRILGLSYAEYLRMMRDSLKGKIVGKEGYAFIKYPQTSRQAATEFVRDVNTLLTETFNFLGKEEN